MDRCDLQGLVLVERRQQAGQAAGQEGLAGARRAAEQQVVRAGGGHQQGALGGGLALDLGQVWIREGRAEQAAGLVGQQRGLAGEVSGDLQQVVHGEHRQPAGQAGLFGIFLRYHQNAPCVAPPARPAIRLALAGSRTGPVRQGTPGRRGWCRATPLAARMPSAMARSKRPPSLGRSAGARLR